MTRAGRIYTIILKLKSYKTGKLDAAWNGIFKTKDIFTTYCMLRKLHQEIKLLEQDLEQSDMKNDFYKPVMTHLERIVSYNNFNASAQSVINTMPDTILERLNGFMHNFGDNEETIELDIDKDIKEMVESTDSIENEELKALMLDITQTLVESKIAIEIGGAKGLEETFKNLFCKISSNLDLLSQAPSNFKESLYNATIKIKTKLESLDKVITWIERGKNFLEFFDRLG